MSNKVIRDIAHTLLFKAGSIDCSTFPLRAPSYNFSPSLSVPFHAFMLLFIFICPGSCLINYSQPSTKLLSFLSR